MTTTSDRIDSDSRASAPAGYRLVEISREPVELYKILKFEGLADSGGHAKAAVAAGEVWVNGKVELQKRKKILSGDTIEFAGDSIYIKLALSS